MTGGNALWVWLAIIGACIGAYYLYKQGKIPWLKGRCIKLPRMLEPKIDTQIERLKSQTEREIARAAELRNVLEEKRKLAKARAESSKLRKEIDGISAQSVERAEQDEIKAQDAAKVKPRRL